MELADAEAFLAANHRAALVTLSADGTPHSSNISYHFAGGVARVSVTAGRIKSRNLARDPRALLHVFSDNWGQWLAAEGTAELSAVSGAPGDEVGRELLDLYERIVGEAHPDRADFFAAMVRDRRLLISIPITRVYGQLPS
ncbi:MAG: PPOX class F420-dependent oxidoreductase [Acidimicrobiia bacterium]|nr:PPOX class F420-dependent oxidoreductase [Acidimicrobiia bacterium]